MRCYSVLGIVFYTFFFSFLLWSSAFILIILLPGSLFWFLPDWLDFTVISSITYCIFVCDVYHTCHYLFTSLSFAWELSSTSRCFLELEPCRTTWWVVYGEQLPRFLAGAVRWTPFCEGHCNIVGACLEYPIKSSSPPYFPLLLFTCLLQAHIVLVCSTMPEHMLSKYL